MRNRRDFIRTMAGVTAGAFVVGPELVSAQGRGAGGAGAGAAAGGGGGQGRGGGANADPGFWQRSVVEAPTGPVQRKIIQVGGRRVRVVDVHAHVTVPEVSAVLTGTQWANQGGGRPMGDERIWEMDRRGIDVQAISINGYWWYEIQDRALAEKVVRAHDEGLAKWCKAHSDRFVALTSPSLQFPDLAAAQVDYAVKTLGFRGASMGGHVNGQNIADPKFDPFWAKLNELQVPVFEHPGGADNVLKPDAWAGTRGALGNIIGNPLETTVFLSNLIHGGVFDKFPNLRVVGAHGGGYLPSYLGRTDVACEVRNGSNCLNRKRPSEYFKTNILVDTMVFSGEDVRHLVAKSGPTQVIYGTDIPIYNWPDAIQYILEAEMPNATKEMVLGGNLTKLLKLPPANF